MNPDDDARTEAVAGGGVEEAGLLVALDGGGAALDLAIGEPAGPAIDLIGEPPHGLGASTFVLGEPPLLPAPELDWGW